MCRTVKACFKKVIEYHTVLGYSPELHRKIQKKVVR